MAKRIRQHENLQDRHDRIYKPSHNEENLATKMDGDVTFYLEIHQFFQENSHVLQANSANRTSNEPDKR